MSPAARLVGLDWGTSSLRAWLLGDHGAILDARSRPWGIRELPEGGFEAALAGITSDWPTRPLIASGMIGSRGGWREAPYVGSPVGVRDIATTLTRVERDGPALHIVPGLLRADHADVIRGEETQIIGAIARYPELERKSAFVLPGTHSKWVSLADGRITHFSTYMTGELYALLLSHSILGESADDTAEADDADFLHGVRTVRDAGDAGLYSRLFSTRALMLDGRLAAGGVPGYLSGLLVGEELRAALAGSEVEPDTSLTLIGNVELCARYHDAAACFGLSTTDTPLADSAARGLWEIANASGLLDSSPDYHAVETQ